MNELMTTDQALKHATALDVIRPTGLILPKRLTRDDYYSIAVLVGVMTDSNGYARADLAYRAKLDFAQDDKYKLAWEELATMWGKVYGTIANDALVGEKYSHKERKYWMDNGVKYSALRICAPVEPREARNDLLRECAKGLSITKLCEKVYGPSPKRLPPPSRDAPLRERVGGWLDTLNESDRQMGHYYVNLFVEWLES